LYCKADEKEQLTYLNKKLFTIKTASISAKYRTYWFRRFKEEIFKTPEPILTLLVDFNPVLWTIERVAAVFKGAT